MKITVVIPLILIFTLASCDLRSGTAKKEMEKFETKPTPAFSPLPTPTPVDPADVLKVQAVEEPGKISINGSSQTQPAACKKFDRVIVNGDDNTLTIKGACSQIMLNGDRNKVMVDTSIEFVMNGSENEVSYAYFPNGKPPVVIENRAGNRVEKVSPKASTTKPQIDKK